MSKRKYDDYTQNEANPDLTLQNERKQAATDAIYKDILTIDRTNQDISNIVNQYPNFFDMDVMEEAKRQLSDFRTVLNDELWKLVKTPVEIIASDNTNTSIPTEGSSSDTGKGKGRAHDWDNKSSTPTSDFIDNKLAQQPSEMPSIFESDE